MKSLSEINAQTPIPALPLRNGVLFPNVSLTLPIGRSKSVAMVQSLEPGDLVSVVVQRNPSTQDPGLEDLHPIGTIARVHQVTRHSRQTYRLTLQGLARLEIRDLLDDEETGFLSVFGVLAAEENVASEEAVLLAQTLKTELESNPKVANTKPNLSDPEDPAAFSDLIASSLGLATPKEVEILMTLDVTERLRLIAKLIGEQRTRHEVKREIEQEVKKSLSEHQREAILREQLKAINKELGDDNGSGEMSELIERIEAMELPEEVRKVVDRESRRARSMRPGQPEYNVIRTYLELIADLPWNDRAEVSSDLNDINAQLDEDHFGLDDVKERILEHMAVMKLSGNPKGTILCLAGPPGVGKTSLGQSIADATGRPFMRIALGGIRDEAEIRGHRRTYIGALPGRILHALRKSEAKNPLILLDEIDKLGKGWMGSPESALLEVLDPEQNSTFTDNYLELPFDLSEVFFICTANNLQNISGPLRDRLEIIQVPGYTLAEKAAIAHKHLLPKQLEEHGIHEDMLRVTEEAIQSIVLDYTREAGVRQLKREVTKMCRSLALKIARNPDSKIPPQTLTPENIPDFLGKPKYFNSVAERTASPGVATGLAWTPVGGDILFIETTSMSGQGRLQLTGQLGDVMKESAHAALAYLRTHADELKIDEETLKTRDLHLHIPAGAVPKDGPSAGVTIFTALTSLLTGRRVRSDTAMTGECSLRGRVLPVGGIKSKVLAAQRAGITRVILPHLNERDLDDLPQETRDTMEFILAQDMSQVLEAALEPADATPEPTQDVTEETEELATTPVSTDEDGDVAPATSN